MQSRKVLFVLTSHDRLGKADDTSADRTGFHLAEAARPWKILSNAGYQIDIATPSGNAAPVDPGSMDLDDRDNAEFMSNARIRSLLERPASLREVDLDDYEAIYFPGGHGTMWDLPNDKGVQSAIRNMYEAGKIVGAICHGPAAFVNAKLSDGSWLVDGKIISVFTDEEERAVEKDEIVPFLLASKLEARGASLRKADNFKGAVSVDGLLVTGQNPASAHKLGEAMRDLLERLRDRAA